jgi:hypothetical protein
VAGGASEGALTRPETVNINVVVHHHVQQVLALLGLKESGIISVLRIRDVCPGSWIRIFSIPDDPHKKFVSKLFIFVGSGILNPGWEEIRIRDKNPGIAALQRSVTALDRQDTATGMCETKAT